jgi:hypothetical protein
MTISRVAVSMIILCAGLVASADDSQTPRLLKAKTTATLKNDVQASATATQKRGLKTRRLASLDSHATSQGRITRTSRMKSYDRPFEWKIALSGGISSLGASDKDSRTSMGEAVPTSTISLGLASEIAAWKYVGLGIDAFYNLPAKSATDGETRTEKKLGAMIDAGVRYPFWLGNVRIVPKAGLGYGTLSMTGTSVSNDLALSTVDKAGYHGIYATVGLEVMPFNRFTIGLDFAQSLKASGNISYTGIDTPLSYDFSDAKFNRLRVGGYYRIFSDISLGAQFVSRSVSSTIDFPSDTSDAIRTTTSYTQSQIMGVLIYEIQ